MKACGNDRNTVQNTRLLRKAVVMVMWWGFYMDGEQMGFFPVAITASACLITGCIVGYKN